MARIEIVNMAVAMNNEEYDRIDAIKQPFVPLKEKIMEEEKALAEENAAIEAQQNADDALGKSLKVYYKDINKFK